MSSYFFSCVFLLSWQIEVKTLISHVCSVAVRPFISVSMERMRIRCRHPVRALCTFGRGRVGEGRRGGALGGGMSLYRDGRWLVRDPPYSINRVPVPALAVHPTLPRWPLLPAKEEEMRKLGGKGCITHRIGCRHSNESYTLVFLIRSI